MARQLAQATAFDHSAIDLVDPELYASGDPHAIWRHLRENHPVFWHEPRREMPGFWALTRYDDVLFVLHHPDAFGSANGILLRPVQYGPDPGGGKTLALTDPPRHHALRSVVQSWFNERAVRALKCRMQGIVDVILDRALELETCDFVRDVAGRLPLYVICLLMGVPDADREHLFSLTSKAFGASQAHSQRMAHVELMEYFIRLANKRRRDPEDDIVSALANTEIDGQRLTDRELILNCDNVLVGGTENVRIAAAGGLLALTEHRDQWEELRREPALVPSAVEEILRWTTTPIHIMRTTRVPVSVQGRPIQPGERITLWLPSANRDDSVFPEPDQFNVRRKPNRHLALGNGEHFCLGGSLARAELRMLYREMITRSIDVELTAQPTFTRSIVVHGPETIPARLKS